MKKVGWSGYESYILAISSLSLKKFEATILDILSIQSKFKIFSGIHLDSSQPKKKTVTLPLPPQSNVGFKDSQVHIDAYL